jgi:(p)ppGpp synthase/HD superfamily hydrolase
MPLHKIKSILSYAETRTSFFTRIERYHSRFSKEYLMIERAYDDMENAFVEVYRSSDDPYYTHPRAVAIILIDYLYIFERIDITIPAHEILVAVLMHDNPEDRPDIWPLDRIERDYSRNIAWLLDYLSKRPLIEFGGDKIAQLTFYHDRFHTAPIEFFLSKLPDRLHNQITIWSCDEDKILRKMIETQKFYLPWARRLGILAQELEATICSKEQIKKYIEKNSLIK